MRRIAAIAQAPNCASLAWTNWKSVMDREGAESEYGPFFAQSDIRI